MLTFAKRYNANIGRFVYYVKTNSNNYKNAYELLDACCAHFNIDEWACKAYNSKTHKFALKVINTNTGQMLQTDATF